MALENGTLCSGDQPMRDIWDKLCELATPTGSREKCGRCPSTQPNYYPFGVGVWRCGSCWVELCTSIPVSGLPEGSTWLDVNFP